MNFTNSIQNTQNALGAVAAWMAHEANIKIVWNNGTECVADLKAKTLSIPRLVESDMLDGEKLWIARGHIYHEAGHVAETKLDDRVNNGGLHAVVNALEDRRMEHVLADRYAGCKVAFKKQLVHYSGELANRFSTGKLPAQYEALCALSFEVEGISPEWTLSAEADRICGLIRDDFRKVFDCKTSKDAVDLGIVIWDKLKQDEEDQNNQPDNDQSQNNNDDEDKQNGESDSSNGNGQSEDGEEDQSSEDQSNGEEDGVNQSKSAGEDGDETEGNSQSDGEEGEEGESQNGHGNGDAEDSDGEDSQNGKSGNQSNGQSSNEGDGQSGEGKSSEGDDCEETDGNQSGSQNGSQKEELVKSLEAMMAEAEGECGLDAIEGEAFKKLLNEDAVRNASDVYTSYRANDEHFTIPADNNTRIEYKEALEECNGEAAILARKLEEYLRTITRTKMLHCQRRGKLDPRRYAVLAKGLSKEVFKHLSNRMDMDTAVEIVFDESGSMSEYREVRKAIMIIAEALDRVHIPFEITGGTTLGGNFPRGFTRANPICYNHYKTFDQNWTTVRSAIQHSGAHANFIDGEMVEFAATRLVERPERRKIIFSLSDGCPCGGEGNDYELGKKLIRVCSECREHGIEVYSFGVDTDAPCQYYGAEYFVKLSGYEIGKGLSTGITSVLTRGRVA